ncbi:DUF4139 domain-containing protein [Lysobacter cavernae]|uniref:DUF4139 domain-containing protein n=1 Tax=Lysobacter cavernae TaxID=1685901 RepID=A0ABV7RPX8_9GAMM
MKHPLSLLALACTLAACTQTGAPEPVADQARPAPTADEGDGQDVDAAPNGTRLTIYSGDYEALATTAPPHAGMPGHALVERSLRYALKAGSNAISADSVPPSMDVEAATLRAQTAGVVIEGQRYVAALSGTRDVLAQAIGRKATVEHTAGGAKQTDTGTLLSANDGLTLALDDSRVKVIRNYDSFSLADSDELLPKHASLQWNVRADRRGDADFLLAYPMGGMAWRAEYLATLTKGDGCQLALDGAALVANRSGVTFEQAKVSLVAGEPNRDRIQVTGSRMMMAADAAAAPAPPPPDLPSERSAGEYHAYDLPKPVRLAHGSTERVPLFAPRTAIACERAYVVDAGGPDWQPPRPLLEPDYRGQTGPLPVTATVSVQNTRDAGLGQPLPAGRVRVFDGGDFLGESRLPHTATAGEIRLQVGKPFDLTAKRESTGFRLDRAGRTITESFAVTLKNAKKVNATVRVIEPLPRWSDWDIVTSSVPGKKKDARHAEFEVPVPANGETTLTYTVRYRWTQDVNP